jgi:hypothetical protein
MKRNKNQVKIRWGLLLYISRYLKTLKKRKETKQ